MNRPTLIIATFAALAIYLLGLFTCNGYYKGKYQCPTIKADTVKILVSDTGNWHTYPYVSNGGTYDGDYLIDSGGGSGGININNIDITKPLVIDSTTDVIYSKETPSIYFNPTDSISIIKQLQKQYSDLLNVFYTINKYTDTTHLKNGIVKVQSVVQRNKLMAQRVILDSAFETTITKTPTPINLKEKTQLWAGIDLYGNKHDYLSGAGISAMLKFPHIAITVGTYFDQYNNINYSAGIRWLIKLKK